LFMKEEGIMDRRSFIKKPGIATAGMPFMLNFMPEDLWAKIPSGIKITGLKTFLVGHKTYVKVYTNKGVTGLGSGSITGLEISVDAAIRDRERIIVGEDPTNIEFLWQAIFRWPRSRGGAVSNTAISAIEIALWDILGKLLDVPIYKLLGGAARDSVRVYVHIGGKDLDRIAEQVRRRKEEGLTCVRTGINWSIPWEKVNRPWNLKLGIDIIRTMREAGGDDIDIIDDAHNLMTPPMVLEYLDAIEQYRLMFIEDPVTPENMAGLKWLQAHTNVPIAIGESNYTKFGYFRDIIFNHLANYVRPDVINCGGISEAKKICAMAESNFIDACLHGNGGPVRDLASTHVSVSTPNCVMQESRGSAGGWMLDLFNGDNLVVKDGYAQLPEKPGLGCDLNEDVAKKHPYEPGSLPHPRYPDGSVSDW
ncbi:enolase C-terminal domain-like protein, partial [Candidatus Latescibacterota bacterium]